jgi:nucleoside 2-deoxyribosyltransferase
MKIYFAGSVTGGREDQEFYGQIIKELQDFGDVLTEHLANQNLSALGESLTAQQIFQRDMAWLKQADVVVAEVTTPSLGVGYEIGQAESLGKSILCLFRELPGKRVSGMVRGNPQIKALAYKDIGEVKNILQTFFNSI